jgi:hypothetical protein
MHKYRVHFNFGLKYPHWASGGGGEFMRPAVTGWNEGGG